YEAEAKESLKIEVLDVIGRILEVREVEAKVGLNNIPTDLNRYSPGTYMIRVHNKQTGNVHIAKVIKDKF
ncbi:MAG: T9SS type A sorting domain-containing protein, partial [Aureispira sp.]|nr:T9SS type A sorting domain-containing protein [Aureispira sp.]